MITINKKHDFCSISGLQRDIDLSKHSSWRCGGNADYFFQPENKNKLCEFIKVYGRDYSYSVAWLREQYFVSRRRC